MKLEIWKTTKGWHWEIFEYDVRAYNRAYFIITSDIQATRWGAKRKGCKNMKKLERAEIAYKRDIKLEKETRETISCDKP